MRLPIKAQIRTQKCNKVHSRQHDIKAKSHFKKREVRSHNKVR